MSPQEIKAIAERAAVLAGRWQNRANELLTHEEKGIQEQMLRLLTHPLDKVVLTKLIDQSFRSHNPARIADQANSILRQFGVPDFFNKVDRLLVQMFLGLGRRFPTLTVPKMIDKMRQNSSRAIIDGDPDNLREHLEKRRKQGVRMNINHLGEALLGETDARRRLETYVDDLKNPAVEYISVKISTIYSQIHSLAWEHTLNILVERLAELYRAAAAHYYTRIDGTRVAKFVNLDMEEYRDLRITVEAFQRTLDQPEFKRHSAGIVLQAYLPDSFGIQKQLTEWALHRVADGGSPIKLRIVKGANMEMEQVDAAINNWPLAPYDNKREVDANYKRMVMYGMQPERIRAANLGIASHNLFELAFAHELGRHHGVTDCFYFEMLEGMADHVRRALVESAGDVLLYAPVATKEDFINAIAYLVRRLDENTAPENFLRYAPKLSTTSKEWDFLKQQFFDSCRAIDQAGIRPHRTQNRQQEVFRKGTGTYESNEFLNEPDTDWSLAANRQWAESIRVKWKMGASDSPVMIPIVAGGREVMAGREQRDSLDASQFHDRVVVARYALAGGDDVERAVSTAVEDSDGWRTKSLKERHAVLSRVARELRRARGDLIGAAAADTGKVFPESDVEVSEAVDFAEYYPHSAHTFAASGAISIRGKGVGCVVSPWNFPIAIPCGGIVASLAAGNTVIFKPSSDAVLVAWLLCQCFWRAGVSKNTLQFLPCSGSQAGQRLVTHTGVDFVILTGGTETGLKMLSSRPKLFLAAETGGKNATIVTAMSDRDQAIKNIIHSAFSNCGQKCSATSLLILEEEVYGDGHFKQQLVDAAGSIQVGSAWDFKNKLGPLIRPPVGVLKRGIEQLEPGESWALEPRNLDGNPYFWTPGIKWDVAPGSFTHTTELFGPVLGVMRADSLEQAIDLVNATGFGLTSGLESLDRREQDFWKERVRAGNLYINRGTTGAVTLRQPFGGMGKSALGPAIKAGSPNYVSQFMSFKETAYPRIEAFKSDHAMLRLAQEWQRKADWGSFGAASDEIRMTVRAIKSYLYHFENEFSRNNDYFHLRGQDNILRYLPVGRVMVRIHEADTLFDVLARIAAARVSGCNCMISVAPGVAHRGVAFLKSQDGLKLVEDAVVEVQTDEQVIDAMPDIQRIRYADPQRVPAGVFKAAAKTGYYIACAPVMMEGRIELLHYVVNQSICDTYHRYGNLGERSMP